MIEGFKELVRASIELASVEGELDPIDLKFRDSCRATLTQYHDAVMSREEIDLEELEVCKEIFTAMEKWENG